MAVLGTGGPNFTAFHIERTSKRLSIELVKTTDEVEYAIVLDRIKTFVLSLPDGENPFCYLPSTMAQRRRLDQLIRGDDKKVRKNRDAIGIHQAFMALVRKPSDGKKFLYSDEEFDLLVEQALANVRQQLELREVIAAALQQFVSDVTNGAKIKTVVDFPPDWTPDMVDWKAATFSIRPGPATGSFSIMVLPLDADNADDIMTLLEQMMS
jgi:hypothetical protein